MEEDEVGPIAIKDMDKCAIIYRSNAVSFVYVCYHCGADFTNIDSTLKHIESHFQLVQITIDEKNVKSECVDTETESNAVLEDESICDTINTDISIKAELMEIDEDGDGDTLEKPMHFECSRCDSTFSSKFSFGCHTIKEHSKDRALECVKCEKKFKRDSAFKSHLRQHIDRGEVDWKCEGDGIRDTSTTVFEHPKEQSSPNQLKKQPEKRQSAKLKPEKRPAKLKPEPKPAKLKLEPKPVKLKTEKAKSEKVRPEKERPDKVKPEKVRQVKAKPEKRDRPAKVQSEEPIRQLSTYFCHKCSDTYNASSDLKDHLNSHPASDILQINKCKECKTYFESAFDLRLHVLDIHLSIKKFKCSTCWAEFEKSDKLALEKHLESHLANHSAKWVNMRHGICNNGMDATVFEEITTTSESPCELCEEKFYLKSNLDEHVGCIHWDNEHKFRCPQCESVFTKTKSYFAHQLEHRRVGITVTETDMKVLITNLDSYIDEQYVCNDGAENAYKCSICELERNNLSEIRVHVRERHVYKTLPQPIKPILKEKIACNICGMFVTRGSLRAHSLTHVEGRKFPCSFCGRVFSKNYSKKTHERMHTGEKPFQCDQCGKRFFSNSLLGAHKQSHDNTTYPCKICGRVFNIPSGYRRHMQTHRKDQSYECTICSKSFNTRVYLTRHIHKHNEKTFQCSFCENKFRSAKGQRQHEKTQHNYEPPI